MRVQNANVGGYTSRGFVEVLAASQSPSSTKWFQGTADAVRQYLWLFENAIRDGIEDFLILSGTEGNCCGKPEVLSLMEVPSTFMLAI